MSLRALLSAALVAVIALAGTYDAAAAAGLKVSASAAPSRAQAVIDVTVDNRGTRRVVVGRSDFRLSASGDIFGVQQWNARRSRIRVAPGDSRDLRLTFAAPATLARRAALSYRSAGARLPRLVPVHGSRAVAQRPTAYAAADAWSLKTFSIPPGVGHPWGTTIDRSGNIWFAESGCDFTPTCPIETPPGMIGKLDPSSGVFRVYTLPDVPGNQPIFVEFDGSGALWFTTPNNSMIGRLDPRTGSINQWPVTPGSGPWDLTFANGQIWYTEHLGSAVGAFDPNSHTHQDFPTPSANSNPYGITAASGGRLWFTENNSNVDRVAVLDTTSGNAISEYPIAEPANGTPHMIVMGPNGQPWWTDGFASTLATLNPAAATPGSCGVASGVCVGIQRFPVPASTSCSPYTHVSGIAYEAAAGRLWIDNSLAADVGSFTPATGTFAMTRLTSCDSHPHDGLIVDAAGDVWFDEEFTNAIGELALAGGPPPPRNTSPPAVSGGTRVGQTLTVAGTVLAPANAAAPTIQGVQERARTLTAANGSWTNQPTHFSYRWQRCHRRCADIPRATGDSYTLTRRDVDARVRVVVTASNNGGSARAKSARVGPIGPSLQQVKAALSRLLAAGTIKRRDKRVYRTSFRAPSRGRLTVAWRARSVLLGTAHRRFAKAGRAKVTIPLTGKGKRLLKGAKKLTIVATAVFVRARERAVVSRKRVRVASVVP